MCSSDLGVVLYEALTGRLPFDGTPITVLMHKQMREPDPPRALDASIPADLDALASELLRFDPLRRATGADVARRLGIEGIIRAPSLSPSGLSTTVPFVGRGNAPAALLRACATARPQSPTSAEKDETCRCIALARQFGGRSGGAWAVSARWIA